jgi:hypothetical protein
LEACCTDLGKAAVAAQHALAIILEINTGGVVTDV